MPLDHAYQAWLELPGARRKVFVSEKTTESMDIFQRNENSVSQGLDTATASALDTATASALGQYLPYRLPYESEPGARYTNFPHWPITMGMGQEAGREMFHPSPWVNRRPGRDYALAQSCKGVTRTQLQTGEDKAGQ